MARLEVSDWRLEVGSECFKAKPDLGKFASNLLHTIQDAARLGCRWFLTARNILRQQALVHYFLRNKAERYLKVPKSDKSKRLFTKTTFHFCLTGKMRTFITRMKPHLCLYSLLLFFAACSKPVEERSHTVVNIVDGNTIQLKNGLTVHLIGVEATPESRGYLENNLVNTKIRFFTDRSNDYKIRSAAQEVYAYVRTIKGVSLNAELLKRRFATIRTEYLTDSLTAFRKYADNEMVTDTAPKTEARAHGKQLLELPGEPSQPAEPQSLRELVKIAEPCVFLIYALNNSGDIISSGTGFYINDKGLAVSNYHVFEGASQWKIKTRSGRFFSVSSVIRSSKDVDYLVFQVDTEESPYLRLSEQLPEKGEDIFVLGNPKGLESTLTRGVVSAFRDMHTHNDFIQIDAAISPGSSGSPVMNMQGEVIGIATAKLDACESCNFAVNIQLVAEALQATPEPL